jgi:hypothetical protein
MQVLARPVEHEDRTGPEMLLVWLGFMTLPSTGLG